MRLAKPNPQYNVAAPDSFAVRVATWQRRRMYTAFLRSTAACERDSILDVGVTSDRSYASSNYLEAWHPSKDRITAVGIDNASFLEQEYPGVRFVCASGLALPFADRSFDLVHSSAVLEHVGSTRHQAAFVRECMRVARKAVFLTTPNRWFPVEFHTLLPFAHWLPRPWFRWLLRRIGLEFFAEESHLNLLSRREMAKLAAPADGYRVRVLSVALLGWPSNLLLIACRRTEAGQ